MLEDMLKNVRVLDENEFVHTFIIRYNNVHNKIYFEKPYIFL